MFIQVTISIAEGDTNPGTPAECADKVLTALGGDATKDICNVSMSATGSAGNVPAPASIPSTPAPSDPMAAASSG